MHALTLLAACLLLAWSSPAHAQCVSMNNNATHGFTAECAMVLQYSDATIQGGTDDCRVSPNRRIQMLQTLLSLSAVPPACKRAFFKYSCAAVYIPCTGGRVASPCSPLKQIADPSVCPANIYTLVTSSLGLIADQVWPTTQAGITVNDTEEGVQIFSSHAACQNLDDESTVFKADALTTEVDATGTPVVDSVYGQAHGTFYPRCRAYSGSICSAVIPPTAEVYVRAGLSFAQLEGGVALNAKNAFQAVNKFDCLEPMMNAACATAMPRCDQTALALALGRFRNMPNYDGAVGAMLDGLRPIANAPFPRFAARDLCDKVHAASSRCSPTVVSGLGAASALQFANCAGAVFIKERTCQAGGVIGLSLVPLYPETGNVTLLDLTIPNNLGDDNTLGVVIPANEANDGPYSTYTYDPSVFNDQVECQHPMVKPDDPTYRDENTDGASCVPPCPMFAYTDTEYDRVSVVMWITTLCSFILSTMMVATYALFKRMRKSVYTIYFTCDIFVVSIALFFSVATESPDGDPEHDSPWAHSRCRDNSRPLLTGYCAFQAFAMVFCGGSAVAWWFIQSCDLYLQIAWNAGKWLDDRKRIKDIIYHVWGFGYPALNIIVCASLDKLGNSQVGIAWCFITDSDLAWGIFYGPIGVQTVLGVGFMILIMRAIWRSSQATGSAKKPGWWKIYIRPMLFISCFLIVWAFVFAYRFSESFNEDTYKADGKEFAACLLGGSTEAQCEPLRPRPNLFLWYVVHFMIGSVGIFCFALYGTHTMFIMWFHYLICDKDYNYSRTNDLSTGTGSRGKGSSRNLSRQGSRKGNLSRQGSRKGSRRGLRRGQGSSGSAETTSTSQDGLNYGSKSDKPKKGSVMLSEI